MNGRSSRTIRRRTVLRSGAGALLGALCTTHLAAADRRAAEGREQGQPRAARNCILIYLLGGPSHLDMWDLKPQAPKEIRGPFRPIETAVPGMLISEHLPQLARQARHLALVRSVSHNNNDHPYMTYYTLTGRIAPVPLGANTVLPPTRSDDPHMGSVVAKFKHDDPGVPGYVAIPEVRVRMSPAPIAGGGRAGYLGPRFDPLAVNDDPMRPLPGLDLPAGVSSQRFAGREALLAVLDGWSARSRKVREYVETRSTALGLTRSAAGGGLFDLEAEPAALRERYGRDRFGQSVLLARRLIERGVSFVGVHFNYMSKCDGWDTHGKNFECLEKELLPMLDRGLSALLEDLDDRGLMDETLIVTMGEFGRTPKINANAGRDHWGRCGTAVFAGGGINGGTIFGASDKDGAFPSVCPVSPADITATVFHGLGLDPEQVMYDRLERPLPLSTGRAIRELF